MFLDSDRWQEIWVTITHNKSRSVMTGFGVFWGILMLILLLGAGNGFKNGVFKSLDGFATNSAFFFTGQTSVPYKGYGKGRYWKMRNRDIETIRRQVDGVEYLSPIIMHNTGTNNVVYGLKSGTYLVRGILPQFFLIETQELLAGRLLNEIDMELKRKVCVIGSEVRNVLFGPDVNPIGKYIRANGIYYQVVGVVKPIPEVQIGGRSEESVNVPFTTLQQTGNFGDSFWFLAATAKEGYPCKRMTEDILRVLKIQNEIAPEDDSAVVNFTIAEQFELVSLLFLGINLLIWIVGIGTLLAGIIGVSNIMMVTVRERTREIGVRRAIGASPFSIVSQIMSESLTLTAIAGSGGLCLGVVLLELINRFIDTVELHHFSFSNLEISFGAAFSAFLVMMFSGLLAGLIPTWRALQIKAIEAIRDE